MHARSKSISSRIISLPASNERPARYRATRTRILSDGSFSRPPRRRGSDLPPVRQAPDRTKMQAPLPRPDLRVLPELLGFLLSAPATGGGVAGRAGPGAGSRKAGAGRRQGVGGRRTGGSAFRAPSPTTSRLPPHDLRARGSRKPGAGPSGPLVKPPFGSRLAAARKPEAGSRKPEAVCQRECRLSAHRSPLTAHAARASTGSRKRCAREIAASRPAALGSRRPGGSERGPRGHASQRERRSQ
jgi:hypothetical protein